MSKYKLIIEYYQKGNNNSQIATLCSCSRTIVWTVLKRIKALRIEGYVLNDMSEEEIASLLFPERAKAGDGYLIPELIWKEHWIPRSYWKHLLRNLKSFLEERGFKRAPKLCSTGIIS